MKGVDIMDLEKYFENSFMEEFFKTMLNSKEPARLINAIIDISESLKSIDESLQIIANRDS